MAADRAVPSTNPTATAYVFLITDPTTMAIFDHDRLDDFRLSIETTLRRSILSTSTAILSTSTNGSQNQAAHRGDGQRFSDQIPV